MPIAKLAKLAEADNMPALGLADTNNLFGALEFSEKLWGAGIQPLVGVTLGVDLGDIQPTRLEKHPSLVLLAQSKKGYENLMALVSQAFMQSEESDNVRVYLEQLSTHNEGLFMLTGGQGGVINKALVANQHELARERLEKLHNIYRENMLIELQRHGLRDEKIAEPHLIEFANTYGLPLVATNQPYFATRKDFASHDALLAISEGQLLSNDERRHETQEHYFKTQAEMVALFEDIPEAIENTLYVAQKITARPMTRNPILPRFAEGDEGAELAAQAHVGLLKRFETNGIAEGLTKKDYVERLEFELTVIANMKFPGYFLIVADFIKWAKMQGIPVGPGRGSGAGSLVAYALTITDLDPLRFGLLFERFLNPERVSMPDFDIDFCQDRREEVIKYVQAKYGRAQVAQIITFGSLQARGVLRDVGRVLEMPYGQVDKLCKLVPQNPTKPISLTEAIEGEAKLREEAKEHPVVKQLFEIATALEGLNRHASTHAAGIVIGDRPLSQLVPLYRDPKSDMPVTQYNMKWVEPAGLVKFDFLGLKTLTVLQRAVELVARKGVHIYLSTIPLDDEKSYAMLARGETVGVFQVESAGMRKALVEMRASRFEDIIALVALYRPGPMANIPVYCARKNGEEEADYLYNGLEIVLKETHGIVIYQEQVMQIAQILAGYSLGEADMLRRAMGKKIKAEMDKQRERFVSGAVANKVPKGKANEIFDLLAKFADYGFNKSHAAAYALVSYQTAYMKANHPVEFLAASCDYDMSNTDKLAEFRRDALRLNIKVTPPNINHSFAKFEVRENEILYALAAVKGVGEGAAQAIVAARGEKFFKNMQDFAARIDPRQITRKTLESLAAAGAFDTLEPNRAAIVGAIDLLLAEANHVTGEKTSGQTGLFGESEISFTLPQRTAWTPIERLEEELKAVGFFLTGHPLDDYESVLKSMEVPNFAIFAKRVKNGHGFGKLAGSILSKQERRTKTGSKMGIYTFSDSSGQFEAIIFSEGLMHYRDILEVGQAVLLNVTAEMRGDEVSLRIMQVEPLDSAAAKYQRGLKIEIYGESALHSLYGLLNPLKLVNKSKNNEKEVHFLLKTDDINRVEIKLAGFYALQPSLMGEIRTIQGVGKVVEI